MSVALKELLRKNKERKNFVEQGNPFNEFPELTQTKSKPKEKPLKQKNQAAVELGRLGGLKGGKARAAKLTQEQRKAIARKAANARWGNK